MADGKRYWLTGNRCVRDWEACRKEEGVIAVSSRRTKIGDWSQCEKPTEMEESGRGPWIAEMCLDFSNHVREGDIPFMKKGLTAVWGHGVVTSRHRYRDERGEFAHVRDAEWQSNHPEGRELKSPKMFSPILLQNISTDSKRLDQVRSALAMGPGSPEPPESPRFWLMAPGEGAKHWDRCRREGIARIGFGQNDDLTECKTRDDLERRSGLGFQNVLAGWEVSRVVKPGDAIFVKKGDQLVVGHGVVKGDSPVRRGIRSGTPSS